MPSEEFTDPTTATIVAFLRRIGIEVRAGELAEATFLPGILIDRGGLVVDERRLSFPGDLLHEAGHLAVAAPERRAEMGANAGPDAAEEMMAIAWSYAALVHLGLEPSVVFHPEGYKGGSESLIEAFSSGSPFGVPMLQWLGMTCDGRTAPVRGVPPYPHMLRWLRGEQEPAQA